LGPTGTSISPPGFKVDENDKNRTNNRPDTTTNNNNNNNNIQYLLSEGFVLAGFKK